MDQLGKSGTAFMDDVVYRNLGRRSQRVRLGPGRGLDNGVVSIGGGRVMVLTVDPVSIIPRLGVTQSAWLSVHLIASDYTTSGLRPEFAVFEYNFPTAMAAAEREEYVKGVGSACDEIGVSIVGGHTGSYPGGGFTVIGGGMMFGFCRTEDYLDPTMSRPGDAVVMTKGVAIEATSSLANSFPRYTERRVGKTIARKARQLTKLCSTVSDALAAASMGIGQDGVTSMHDATEGGLLGGLDEMAAASSHSITLTKENILVPEEVQAVCSAFRIDPLSSLSEGTLLITCNPLRGDELVGKLERTGIAASVIGSVSEGEGIWMSEKGNKARRVNPRGDPYWVAYAKAAGSARV